MKWKVVAESQDLIQPIIKCVSLSIALQSVKLYLNYLDDLIAENIEIVKT